MRDIQHQAFARNAKLLANAFRDAVGEGLGDTRQIHGHDHGAGAPGVFDGERLGPQVLDHPVRGVLAIGVADHVCRLIRSDDLPRHPRLVVRRHQQWREENRHERFGHEVTFLPLSRR